jgi:hypothetical protein
MALATFATLLVLPAVFTLLLGRASNRSPSLDPDDPASTHYDPIHPDGHDAEVQEDRHSEDGHPAAIVSRPPPEGATHANPNA